MVAADLATPDARSALAELCAAYWYPIYAFIRRKGNDAEKSLDLTQSYFPATAGKGRARRRRPSARAAFALSSHRLRAFLDRSTSTRECASSGAAVLPCIPIDAQDAEGRYAV